MKEWNARDKWKTCRTKNADAKVEQESNAEPKYVERASDRKQKNRVPMRRVRVIKASKVIMKFAKMGEMIRIIRLRSMGGDGKSMWSRVLLRSGSTNLKSRGRTCGRTT